LLLLFKPVLRGRGVILLQGQAECGFEECMSSCYVLIQRQTESLKDTALLQGAGRFVLPTIWFGYQRMISRRFGCLDYEPYVATNMRLELTWLA